MGLDQSAVARKGQPNQVENGEMTRTDEDGNEHTEVTYDWEWEDEHWIMDWRKHPNLEGWMRDKWREKGCPVLDHDAKHYEEGVFNCIDLELDKEDILELKEAVENVELPETGGFFFGDDSSEHYKENDDQFIQEALGYLEKGYTIVYCSSW